MLFLLTSNILALLMLIKATAQKAHLWAKQQILDEYLVALIFDYCTSEQYKNSNADRNNI